MTDATDSAYWANACDGGDSELLAAIHPELSPSPDAFAADLDRIMPLWRTYVEGVSEAGHAASIGTVAYLYRLCDIVQPRSILDLGSGLSSAVFRRWATERGVDCDIQTYDTDIAWLERTREFLEANDLPTDGLHAWPPLRLPTFDLVFHDLANGDVRNGVAAIAARTLNPNGVIVFDDAHHAPHMEAYVAAANDNDLSLYSLSKWTYDAIGRFSMIGIKNDTLADEYARLCATESDIYLHLPRMVKLVELFKATHVVELGARSGVSTVAWLHGLDGQGTLTSVDISPAPPIGEHPHWKFIQGDDTDPAVMDQVPPCDILFIDTSHHYDHTLWELRNWSAKVRQGGLIVCHDTELQRPSDPPCPPTDPDFPVKSAIEVFVAERGWKWLNIPECWGLGIIEVGA